jgi:hypothetical protein
MDRMRDFTALEWLTISGRGRVAVIPPLPESDELRDPRALLGWRVRIDLKEYDVTGVETHSVPSGRPYRGAFGLLVREVPGNTLPVPVGTADQRTERDR